MYLINVKPHQEAGDMPDNVGSKHEEVVSVKSCKLESRSRQDNRAKEEDDCLCTTCSLFRKSQVSTFTGKTKDFPGKANDRGKKSVTVLWERDSRANCALKPRPVAATTDLRLRHQMEQKLSKRILYEAFYDVVSEASEAGNEPARQQVENESHCQAEQSTGLSHKEGDSTTNAVSEPEGAPESKTLDEPLPAVGSASSNVVSSHEEKASIDNNAHASDPIVALKKRLSRTKPRHMTKIKSKSADDLLNSQRGQRTRVALGYMGYRNLRRR